MLRWYPLSCRVRDCRERWSPADRASGVRRGGTLGGSSPSSFSRREVPGTVVGVLDKGNAGAHPRRVCGCTRVSSNNAKHSSSSASTRVHKVQICVWDWISAVSDQLLKR